MRKLLAISCLLVIVALTACGTNSGNNKVDSVPAESGEQSNESHEQIDEEEKVFEQSFEEPFYFDNSFINNTSKVKITLSDYEIVKERSAEDRHKDDTDYVKIFVQAENVGDQNSSQAVIDFTSFKAYDGNGVEITKLISFTSIDTRYVEDEFKAAELRPGGMNEGYLYIPFEENAVPSEIIYFESTTKMLLPYVKQYVFKL